MFTSSFNFCISQNWSHWEIIYLVVYFDITGYKPVLLSPSSDGFLEEELHIQTPETQKIHNIKVFRVAHVCFL